MQKKNIKWANKCHINQGLTPPLPSHSLRTRVNAAPGWSLVCMCCLQTEMMTRAELAFSALDRDNSGYISNKELRKLSAKLSEEEIRALMVKVSGDSDNGDQVRGLATFRKLTTILTLKLFTNIFNNSFVWGCTF